MGSDTGFEMVYVELSLLYLYNQKEAHGIQKTAPVSCRVE